MLEVTTGHEIYADRFISGLTKGLAPLRTFSLDFSNEAQQAGKTVNVQLISPDTAAAWNATSNNFERSAQTFNQVPITFGTAKIAGFAVTPENALNFRPAWWTGKADLNVAEICDSALDDVAALITAANYGDDAEDKIAVALASMGKKAVATIRAKAIAKKLRINRSTLVLAPDYFSALLGDLDANVYGGREAVVGGVIPGLLGFAAVVEMPQLTIPGFVAQSDALACASRAFRPVRDTPYDLVRELVEPETGLVCTHVEYMAGATGALSDSVTLLFKAAVGNGDALLRIVA
jgi:hypothetical protein